jgi:hypothetical protein
MISNPSFVGHRWSFAIAVDWNWSDRRLWTPDEGTLLAASINIQQTLDSIEGGRLGANGGDHTRL